MRPSVRKQLVILIQCSWCLTIIVECGRVGPSEAEKQSAFEQLLGKSSRLRMLSTQQNFEPLTTTSLPPTTTTTPAMPIMLSDEEAKRHDRRHAIPQKKHNNKKDHSKRQHHAGYFQLVFEISIFKTFSPNLVYKTVCFDVTTEFLFDVSTS